MLLMMVLYFYVFRRIHMQLKGRGLGGGGGESRSYFQREQKLSQSLAVILALFAVSWLPLHFMNVAAFHGVMVPHQAFYVGILLSHANSAVNPIVYALKIRKIKSAFKMVWCRYFLRMEYHDSSVSSELTENINITSTTRN